MSEFTTNWTNGGSLWTLDQLGNLDILQPPFATDEVLEIELLEEGKKRDRKGGHGLGFGRLQY